MHPYRAIMNPMLLSGSIEHTICNLPPDCLSTSGEGHPHEMSARSCYLWRDKLLVF